MIQEIKDLKRAIMMHECKDRWSKEDRDLHYKQVEKLKVLVMIQAFEKAERDLYLLKQQVD